ncbi:MAG: purine phosphorylase, partial [Gammaproteobacteria bacterium]
VGTAGGLDPDLAPGALLLPAELRLAGGERLRLPADWHAAVHTCLAARLPVVAGPLVSSRSAVGDAVARQRLRERSGALAVDMESYWLAQAAAAAGVPLLVLRAVADPAAARLPPPLLAALTPDGGLRWQALLACWRPALWPGLWRLRRDFRRAAASLRVALATDATALFPPRG